jgi:astacin
MRLLLLLLSSAVAFGQSAGAVHVVEIDGRAVAYTIQGEVAVTQGDIIIGRASELENFRRAQSRGEKVVRPLSVYYSGLGNAELWPNATMYYTIESDAPVQQNLLDAINYWNSIGPFKIVPRGSEPNYVTFQKMQEDDACSSWVGMVGGQQFINVTPQCTTGSAIHEIGHAWGLMHEQTRSDRDAYVTILYENIDKRFRYDFDQYALSVNSGYYDYDSIMHYGVASFSRNFLDTISTVPPGIPIGQLTGLSAGDVDGISRLYGFVSTQTTVASTPEGITLNVDGVDVVTPHKFDWARGSTHTVSAAETQGSSPRYVFARWSDGGEATHTITASASTTVYCAQFQRQYLVRTGVASGQGTVAIVPAPQDAYLADRQPFRVTATPVPGSRFIRWLGSTFLGAIGLSVSAMPAKVQVAGAASDYEATFTTAPVHVVDSIPRGAQVAVDNNYYFTPVSFSWATGSTHTIAVASPQLQGNSTRRLTFERWEDGSTGVRTVTATLSGATYQATFGDEYLLTTSTVGNGTVDISPPSVDGFYEAGTTVKLTAQPGAGQSLRYWFGDLAGNTAQQTVVMSEDRAVAANFGSPFPWLMFHSASYMINPTPGTTGQAVAPGEMVAIFGSGIGPAAAQSGKIGTDGLLATTIGGVSVTFDRYAAPITYAAPDQINVIVPYGVTGQTATTVTVRNASKILPLSLAVVETVPGLFTYDGSGKGPVAALNEDGTVNSANNPAAPGSVVVLFATGAGVFEKSFADGQIIGAELAAPKAPVYVRFDKLPGSVVYAGVAPTLVNGALQVNVRVPNDAVGGGQVPVRLTVGSYSSPPGTTIWIK